LGLLNVSNIVHVTPDQWIELLARKRKIDISEPSNTAELHLQVTPLHRKRRETYMTPNARSNFVVESTGRRLEGMRHLINISHEAGMRVVVVYVSVTLKTAQHGNANRARRVPADVIDASHAAVEHNFNTIVPLADEAWRIDNDTRPSYKQVRTSAFIRRIK
jgi:predicted kinase